MNYFEQAKERVMNDEELIDFYYELIRFVRPNSLHYEWVATDSTSELLSWAKCIRSYNDCKEG